MPKPVKKPAQGNPTPPDDEDEDPADDLSESQVARITDIVNAAVSGQLSRKLGRAISDAVETAVTPLREQLEARGSRRRDDDPGDDDDDDQQQQQQPVRGKNKGGGKQKDPELESMRKRMSQLEEERKKEREESRNGKRDTLLREQLEAAGVDKNRIRGATAVLRESMKYDEKAGEWVFNAKRDGYDEPLDVGAGVSEWAATDEGKSYLAPPSNGNQQPRGGSGVRPAGGGGAPRLQNGGRPAADPKAAKVQAKQDALKNLTTAIDSLGGGAIPLG